ncbi:MAG TPA: hypothetical protein VGS41_05355 [Chthonomonadales bacterium]|nr:hypothetical protein [Chthonomonadales bacterium]
MRKSSLYNLPCALSLVAAAITPGAPATGNVKPDSGKFITTLHGALFSTDSFSILADGSSRFDENLAMPVKIAIHGVVKTRANHAIEISTSAPGHGGFDLKISGVKGSLSANNRPAEPITVQPNLFPFGNAATHLLDYLVAGYNAAKGGLQSFTVIVVESSGREGPPTTRASLTFRGTLPEKVGGKPFTARRYSLVLVGPAGNVDTEILTDGAGRVLLWAVPGQKLLSVRVGYQSLRI